MILVHFHLLQQVWQWYHVVSSTMIFFPRVFVYVCVCQAYLWLKCGFSRESHESGWQAESTCRTFTMHIGLFLGNGSLLTSEAYTAKTVQIIQIHEHDSWNSNRYLNTGLSHVTVIAVHSGGKKREINNRMSKTVLFNQLRSQLLWWDSQKSTHNHVCTTTRKPNKTREVGSSSKCPFKPSVTERVSDCYKLENCPRLLQKIQRHPPNSIIRSVLEGIKFITVQ